MPKNDTINVMPWYRKVISVPIFENSSFPHSTFLLPPPLLQLLHNVSFGKQAGQDTCLEEQTTSWKTLTLKLV